MSDPVSSGADNPANDPRMSYHELANKYAGRGQQLVIMQGVLDAVRELAHQMERDAAGQSDMLYGYSLAIRAALDVVGTPAPACNCDGAVYYSAEENATRYPFLVTADCPIHGVHYPVSGTPAPTERCPGTGRHTWVHETQHDRHCVTCGATGPAPTEPTP